MDSFWAKDIQRDLKANKLLGVHGSLAPMSYNTKEEQFWVFKTIDDDDRAYKSSDKYNDDPSARYEYDSNVANNKRVKSGDSVVIVNKENILGFARISSITSERKNKEIRRCPECKNNTTFEARTTKLPKYRCNEGHEFDEYVSSYEEVEWYKANYGSSFIKASNLRPISTLKPFYLMYNKTNSINRISADFFDGNFITVPDLLKRPLNYFSPFEAAVQEPDEEYTPNSNDERQKIQQQIKARRGQKKFRNSLISRYGEICMVTGCTILDLLEAAHINPYKGDKDNHVDNGLLLRADIHTLFDLNLIKIEPTTLMIYIDEHIQIDGYKRFHETTLLGCSGDVRPSLEALKKRWLDEDITS